MRRIRSESFREIEEFMRTNKLARFESQYDDQENFQLLPGHKEIIKLLIIIIIRYSGTNQSSRAEYCRKKAN